MSEFSHSGCFVFIILSGSVGIYGFPRITRDAAALSVIAINMVSAAIQTNDATQSTPMQKRYRDEEKQMLFDALLAQYGFFLTIPDLTEITGLSRSTIDRMKRCGQIPLAKMNGSYQMRIDHFIGWWDHRIRAAEKSLANSLQ